MDDLGDMIQRLGFASKEDVMAARAESVNLRFVDLSRTPAEPAAVKSVPESIARRYNLLPIKRDNSVTPNRLMVAIGDLKSGMAGVEDVKLVSRCKVQAVLATEADIKDAIDRAYSGEGLGEL